MFGRKKLIAEGPKTGSTGFAIVIGSFAAFGGFLYGYDTGYIAGVKEMVPWLERFGDAPTTPGGKYTLPSSTDSLVTSILSAGTFVGALLAYPVGDRLGRRFGIITFLVLFCIGVALQTAAPSLAAFVVGRVFAGLGVGGTSCLVPVYQAEVSPKAIRGAIVSGYQWMITIGLLIAAIVVQQTKDYKGASSFRLPIGLQFIWAAILGGGLAVLPESPRWHIMKGHDDKALRALARIYGEPIDSPIVNEEFSEIAANIHHERAIGATSYIDCFRSGGAAKTRLRVLTGIGLQALQQLTGINFIFYYGTSFFTNSGIRNPFLITIATNVVNVGMTVPGMWAVDRFGRRALLLYGAAAMCIAQLIVAAVGVATPPESQTSQKVLVAFVCIFIGHFAATWGPLAWVVTSEIYPTHIRGKAMSMSTASNWLWNFGIGYATPYLVNTGPGNAGLQTNVFWIWSGCCLLGFAFVFFMLPECRGLSLEQVDILYRNSGVFGSNEYRKKIIAENIHDEDTAAYADEAKAKTNQGKTEHVEKRDLA